jgi:hypothetical protein
MAAILSNRWDSKENVRYVNCHCTPRLPLPALSKLEWWCSDVLMFYTNPTLSLTPCRYFLNRQSLIRFPRSLICSNKIQTWRIWSKLRCKVYPPTFQICNTSGSLRCNTLISLVRVSSVVSIWRGNVCRQNETVWILKHFTQNHIH